MRVGICRRCRTKILQWKSKIQDTFFYASPQLFSIRKAFWMLTKLYNSWLSARPRYLLSPLLNILHFLFVEDAPREYVVFKFENIIPQFLLILAFTRCVIFPSNYRTCRWGFWFNFFKRSNRFYVGTRRYIGCPKRMVQFD